MDTMLMLADGTRMNGWIMKGPDDSYILVYVREIGIIQGFALFSDATKTVTITELVDAETSNIYSGYTEICDINNEFGNCNVKLRRPA